MLRAVQLDDTVGRVTVEVGDVSVERNVPPEFRALEARAAQLRPKDVFGLGRLPSLSAGELVAVTARQAFGPLTPDPLSLRERGHSGGTTPFFKMKSP